MDQPLVHRGGQHRPGQEHEPAASHPVTASQHDCHLDGTSMAPRCREDAVLLGNLDRLVGGLRGLLDRLTLGEHAVQFLQRDRQGLGESGSAPRLRGGLATFPAPHRAELHPHELGERLLGVTHDFAALRQSPALGFHSSSTLQHTDRSRT